MSTAVHSSPDERPPKSVWRYWQSFLSFAGAELDDAAESLKYDWPAFLFTSLAIGAVVVGSLQTLETFGIREERSVLLESLALTPASVLALSLIALLVWAYWRIRLDPHAAKPYLVAMLAFAIAIGVSILAFGGITTLHLQGQKPPSGLWGIEQAYIWHVLDAVPLLGIPGALGWDQPVAGHDHISGALLLIFKLLVIVPVLRLGLSAYSALELSVEQAKRKRMREQRYGLGRRFDFAPLSPSVFAVAPVLAFAAAGVFVLWRFLFDPSSWPTSALERLLPDGVQVWRIRIPVEWVTTLPQWAAVAAILFGLGIALTIVLELEPVSRDRVVVACGAYVCVLMLMTEAAVALLLALAHVGAISMEPAISPSDQLSAAFSFVVRPVADAIPGLAIPATLHWPAENRFVGGVGGVIQLVYKLGFFVVVLFPVARAIRAYGRDPSVPPQATAGLKAVTEFSARLDEARATLDEAEEQVWRERASQGAGRQPFGPGTRRQYTGRVGSRDTDLLERAHTLLRTLLDPLADVTALFGGKPASVWAGDAVSSLGARLSRIEAARPSRFGWYQTVGNDDEIRAQLDDAKRISDEAARQYSVAATEELRDALPVAAH